MLTKRSQDTTRQLARGTWLTLLLVLLGSFPTLADQAESEAAPGAPAAAKLPPEIEQKARAYQDCVNAVMSTMEPAATKRQQIADRCGGAMAEMVAAFPEEFRQLIEINTTRQIENVLAALEQVETAVYESAEDVIDISEDLDALSESATNN